ncbi:uncharacterized protein MYCFIDRAFT_210044 [Pseudocercospora fijiensis CIRAD86]|uniref:Heterokaryon incompatibility domain-containing protein n=1 Tax=Pseudocercospora fijiensis (strain CIRAD86) TaxID=383855 RepID=N1Q8S2_PSEFD|nr:uncharacterized protein MYCFIDRAFT_210044 [Pseudocercospora fijiensis CIRAD86]EME89290.1 hypothetical protein MYCFIDRAFT_210044 [Pseudocercospora fijiensis CIRAD86]
MLDQQIVFIRMNLWRFLYTLRLRFCPRPKDTIRLWADYICIQQTPSAELSAQVSIMGEIYQAADAVYAWLGEPVYPEDNDMECIEVIRRCRQRDQAWVQIARENRSDFRHIASSKYWTRLWIKQEVILPRDIWFFYGQGVAHWKDIRFAAMLKLDRSRFPRSRRGTGSSDVEQPNPGFMTSLLNLRALRRGPDDLSELVNRFKDAECQDEKDRVYALLSLTKPSIRERITIDYQQSLLSVLLSTYPYWSGDRVTWTPAGDGQQIPTYQYQLFIAQMSKMLPAEKLYSSYQEKDLVNCHTAQAIFTTTGLLEVTSAQTIAAICNDAITPMAELQKPVSEVEAFVLRVLVRSPLPGQPHFQRKSFVYANAVVEKGDMVGRIGNHMLFMRRLETKEHFAMNRELIIQAAGTAVSPVLSMGPASDYLSTQLFPHPSLWKRHRLAGICFHLVTDAIGDERRGGTSRGNRGGVAVSYNTAAIVTLLVDSNMFRRDHDDLDIPDYNSDLPEVWSPYVFGEQNHILEPCQACRIIGRQFSHKWDLAAEDQEEPCSCRWLVS